MRHARRSEGTSKLQARYSANGRRATLVDVDIEGVKKNTDNMNKYVGVMAEMKRRTHVISLFMSGERNAQYKASNIETIGLQFRKMFELIAFASLTAHKDLYSAVYSDFAKHWEAAKLVKRLRQINPHFYPEPVIQIPSDKPGVKMDLAPRQPDYLTEESLVEAHGRCGSLMHAANPLHFGGGTATYSTEWYRPFSNRQMVGTHACLSPTILSNIDAVDKRR